MDNETPTLDTLRWAARQNLGWRGNAADVRDLLAEIGALVIMRPPDYRETVEEEADRLTDCEP